MFSYSVYSVPILHIAACGTEKEDAKTLDNFNFNPIQVDFFWAYIANAYVHVQSDKDENRTEIRRMKYKFYEQWSCRQQLCRIQMDGNCILTHVSLVDATSLRSREKKVISGEWRSNKAAFHQLMHCDEELCTLHFLFLAFFPFSETSCHCRRLFFPL